MGLFQRHILPHLINLGMRNKEVARYRQRLIPRATGRVLEVGVGSGLNLPFYGDGVTRVFGLDPSPELLEMAGRQARTTRFAVEFLLASGEEIPMENDSVDTVVATWTLCSIPDVHKALGEVRRILRPGGRFLFVEHGLAPDADVERWQRRLTPYWKHIGGCHLDRPIADLIRAGGFRIDDLDTGYGKGPRPLTYMYQGDAAAR